MEQLLVANYDSIRNIGHAALVQLAQEILGPPNLMIHLDESMSHSACSARHALRVPKNALHITSTLPITEYIRSSFSWLSGDKQHGFVCAVTVRQLGILLRGYVTNALNLEPGTLRH